MTSFTALLAERGLTRQDFIQLTGYSQRYTRYLASGLEPVTPQVRAALARITPPPPPPPPDTWKRYLHSQGQSERAATLDLEDAPITPRQHGPNSEWRFIPAVQP